MSRPRVPGPRFSLARWSRRKLQAANPEPPAVPAGTAPAAEPPAPAAVELPPVESLTFASDFTPFLRPEVDDQVRRAALKQLFRDPRFNIMDGLDTYIDDYTQADPIAPDVLADLLQRGFGTLPDVRGDAADGASASAAGPAPRDVAESTAPADSGASLSPAQSPVAVPNAQEHAPAPGEAKVVEGEAKRTIPPDEAP
jgi:hypothetical protein